jgi:hypothetical protein
MPSYVSPKVQESVVAFVLTQLTAELRKENEELARAPHLIIIKGRRRQEVFVLGQNLVLISIV